MTREDYASGNLAPPLTRSRQAVLRCVKTADDGDNGVSVSLQWTRRNMRIRSEIAVKLRCELELRTRRRLDRRIGGPAAPRPTKGQARCRTGRGGAAAHCCIVSHGGLIVRVTVTAGIRRLRAECVPRPRDRGENAAASSSKGARTSAPWLRMNTRSAGPMDASGGEERVGSTPCPGALRLLRSSGPGSSTVDRRNQARVQPPTALPAGDLLDPRRSLHPGGELTRL